MITLPRFLSVPGASASAGDSVPYALATTFLVPYQDNVLSPVETLLLIDACDAGSFLYRIRWFPEVEPPRTQIENKAVVKNAKNFS